MSDIKKGEVFRAVVKDLASDGRAVVSHPSGKTVFVPGAWLGEEINVKISGKKGRIGFGALISIEQPSPDRKIPECDFQGDSNKHCGGCPWMIATYKAQLNVKQTRVAQQFKRLGVQNNVLKPIIASSRELAYRNRAQFKTDGKVLGFVANQSNNIIAIDQCKVLTQKNQQTLTQLVDSLPNPLWRPHKRSQWTTIDINEEISADNVSVNVRLPFRQGNDGQNRIMKHWLKRKLQEHNKSQSVLELFCGSGNFTDVIAELGFRKIIAVEGSEQAINQLQAKALQNVTALTDNLFETDNFSRLMSKSRDIDILLLDPPRDGLKIKEGLFHKKSQLSHVYYISCDLATLIRDIKVFQSAGFVVQEVQPLDQFPHTPHIETLVYLKR